MNIKEFFFWRGNLEAKKPLVTFKCISDNNNIDLKGIKWNGVNLTYFYQDKDQQWALVDGIMSLWVIYN
jgi:hypothetical protein